jgi:hypothetical protein
MSQRTALRREPADDLGDHLKRGERTKEHRLDYPNQTIRLVRNDVQSVHPPTTQEVSSGTTLMAPSTISLTSSNGVNSWASTPKGEPAVSLTRRGSSWTATRIVTSWLSDLRIDA